jgi:hypothetical protein
MSPAPKVARDVTQIKRAAPLQQKRAECVWNSDSKDALISYGTQVKVNPEVNCVGTEECTESIAIAYESSVSQSFGTETSISADFWKIMSASVSFSYTHETSESKSVTLTYTSSRPAGSKGYITFQPKYECKLHSPIIWLGTG